MRKASRNRRSGRSAAIIAAVLAAGGVASRPAHAESIASDDPSYASRGRADLSYASMAGLDTTVDTGFQSVNLGPVTAQVRAVVRIDPISGTPLYTVRMKDSAVVEASWNGDGQILLRALRGDPKDGKLEVRHTLTPSLEVKIGAFGFNAGYAFDANALVNKIPGAQFHYDSQTASSFAPWGFDGASAKLTAPDLANAKLFELGFDNFPEIVSGNLDGTFGVRAKTEPTFSYVTKRISIEGASGPLEGANREVKVAAKDGDYLDVDVTVEGEMNVEGVMQIQPVITVTNVFGFPVGSLELPFTVYEKAYAVNGEKVPFQAVVVHVPLPNVHVPKDPVDLGAVAVGERASKTFTILNSGEKAATVEITSANAAVTLAGAPSATIPPGGKLDATLVFSPRDAGAASAEVTVTSNDPDSPKQVVRVTANGVAAPAAPADPDDTPVPPADDSGCGCRTATTTASNPGLLALVGVAVLGLVARRRRAR